MTKIRHHDKKVRHNVKTCRASGRKKCVMLSKFYDIKTFVMTSMSAIYFKQLVMMSQTRQDTLMTSKTRRQIYVKAVCHEVKNVNKFAMTSKR